jgi:hypothetical protein
MKQVLILYSMFVLFQTFILPRELMAQSRGGSQDLGGGNSYEAEARLVMEYSVRHLIENFDGHLRKKKININKFSQTIVNTIILSCPSVPKIEGFSARDAVWQKIGDKNRIIIPNECRVDFEKLQKKEPNSEYLIIINGESWKKKDNLQKRILMLHEALGISEHDDSDYSLSSNLAIIFQASSIPEDLRENIFHELRLSKPWQPGSSRDEWIYPPDVWDLVDYIPTDTVDGIFTFFRISWDHRWVRWYRDVSDSRFISGNVYFQLKDNREDYFNEKEWLRSRKCEKHLSSRQPLNFIVVGEFNRTIVDCGFKPNF